MKVCTKYQRILLDSDKKIFKVCPKTSDHCGSATFDTRPAFEQSWLQLHSKYQRPGTFLVRPEDF